MFDKVDGCAPAIDLTFLKASLGRALVYVEVAHCPISIDVDLDLGMRLPPFELNTAVERRNGEGLHPIASLPAELLDDAQYEVTGSGNSDGRRGFSAVGIPTLR